MHLVSKALTILLILTFAVPRVGAQQQHVVDQAAIQEALDQHAASTLAKRQTIRTALQQPDVVRVANQLGIELARAEAGIATLDGAELDRLAEQAQTVNDELSGGQTARVNLWWVVIGLLILILIIVAVD
jgi:ABC-type dipeptide/oligopeptide/nickel transport system ATPase subunit